mmetsp:Transcript_4161/g.5783  ORF Transcript_4161/g.5783 Transcript_4161/m.5783 type:complete len:474 (-) Transcript_4161:160-1581(-)
MFPIPKRANTKFSWNHYFLVRYHRHNKNHHENRHENENLSIISFFFSTFCKRDDCHNNNYYYNNKNNNNNRFHHSPFHPNIHSNGPLWTTNANLIRYSSSTSTSISTGISGNSLTHESSSATTTSTTTTTTIMAEDKKHKELSSKKQKECDNNGHGHDDGHGHDKNHNEKPFITPSEWVAITNISPLSTIDDLLLDVGRIMTIEYDRGIIDLDEMEHNLISSSKSTSSSTSSSSTTSVPLWKKEQESESWFLNNDTDTETETDHELNERKTLIWPCPIQPHTRSFVHDMKNIYQKEQFLNKRCARFCRKLTRHTLLEGRSTIINNQQSCNSLILACKYDPKHTLLHLLPFLAPSCPFVVYYEYMEPLIDIFQHLQAQKLAINLRLSDTWMREYQVLPGRTHPNMSMSQNGGFLLWGLKLCPINGINELSADFVKEIRKEGKAKASIIRNRKRAKHHEDEHKSFDGSYQQQPQK